MALAEHVGVPTSYAAPTMRAVLLEIPGWLLEQRRVTGEDQRDELWDGVLHMSPSPLTAHNELLIELCLALAPSAKRRGLKLFGDNQSIFDPAGPGGPREPVTPEVKNWRIPDVTIVHPRHLSRRGTEGHAEIVIEVLSAHDEAREKFPYYAGVGCREVWLVTVERTIEVHALQGGAYVRVTPTADGIVTASALGLELQTVATADGPRLRITDGDVMTDV